ncbi:MAG TPA: hypothetical protein VIT85_01025 [Solirubrobacterales bacterium]
MSRRARVARALCCAAVVATLLPAGASALYDNGFDETAGALLVSADYQRLEQGDDSTRFATISADGRYAAFETFARNFFADDDPDPPGKFRAGGIFRFDLVDRSLEKVADGNLFDEETRAFLRRGASNPSISSDGEFVAFSTAQALVPADANSNVDVYVRDMALPLPPAGTCPAAGPCPFELASARDGDDDPAAYGPSPPTPGGDPGSSVSRGVAISGDGRRVVFRTEARSDLPARATADAPAEQLYVRDLAAERTHLVTAQREAGGAMGGQPAGGALGAAISADGSTVAWTGSHAAAQTRFLGGENTDPSFLYYLWRQAPFGPSEPTRRITGIADPDDATCRQQEEASPGSTTSFDATSTGPCFGPLTDQEGFRSDISGQIPALSADGRTVAFLTGAGPRPVISTGPGLDLFLTSMAPGLSRKTATVELTRDTAGFEPAVSAPISSVTLSADARYLAFTSSRTQFNLAGLQLRGEPRGVAGPHELYLVDRDEGTIERAAHSISEGDIDGEVQDGVSLSADAGRIAFTSFAANLFYGDANQRPDAFVVTREDEPEPENTGTGEKAPSTIEELGDGPRINARLGKVRGGLAVLVVSVPEAGRLRTVLTARGATARGTLAQSKGKASGRERVTIALRIAGRPLRLVRSGEKLSARAKVTFTPTTPGRHLTDSVRIVFGASR